jgi:pyruvate-formate lyase-activating enzyme
MPQFFRGIERIHLTGGEPSLHPKFKEWAPKFRELFQCRDLTVESNGFGFQRFPEVFAHFDVVYASLYSEATFVPGGSNYWRSSLDNSQKIADLKTWRIQLLEVVTRQLAEDRRSEDLLLESTWT